MLAAPQRSVKPLPGPRQTDAMRVSLTLPVSDPRNAGEQFAGIEAAGYEGAFTFEASHDPFLPLALASRSTTRLRLGTAVASRVAPHPMVPANNRVHPPPLNQGRLPLPLRPP